MDERRDGDKYGWVNLEIGWAEENEKMRIGGKKKWMVVLMYVYGKRRMDVGIEESTGS